MEAEIAVAQAGVQARPRIKGRWKSAFSLVFANMMDNSEGTGFITSMFPLIREQLGMTLGILGWMAALPKIVSVFFGPFWASVARKYDRKKVLVFVTGLWGLWAVAVGLAQNLFQMVLFVVISLIGASASTPILQELLMDLFGDDERGKAVSLVFGLGGLVMLPLVGVNAWLAGMASGWRYGFIAAGVLSAISGLLIWVFLKDPGRGAAESELREKEKALQESYGLVRWSEVKELFKVKTFVFMLVQRVLSGHLLMLSLGVVYMTEVLKLSLPTANLMMMPLMAGSLFGTLLFGFIGDRIHRKFPRYGRIGTIQFLQGMYVILAFFVTLFIHMDLAIFGVLFFLLTFFGSANMAVNRPIVAAVVRPELRGTAFALFVSVFESIAWGIFNVAAGAIGERTGLQPVFFTVLVVIMLINTLFITLIYKPYAQDSRALHEELKRRAEGAAV